MPTATLNRAIAAVRARAKVLAREDRKMRSELIRLRGSLNMSQAQVAELMGVTQQAVQKLERYDSDMKLSTLRRYANAVGALIEHRVVLDVGQSLTLAAGSQWQYNTMPVWTFAPEEYSVKPTPTRPSLQWSDAKRTEFAVAA